MEITVAQTRAPVPPDLRWPGDGTFHVWQRVVICRKQTIRAFNMPGSVHSNTRHARMYLHAVNEPGSVESAWQCSSNCKGFGQEGKTHYRTQGTVTQTRAPVPPDLQRGVRCQNGLIPGEHRSGFEDAGEKGKGMEGLVMASCR